MALVQTLEQQSVACEHGRPLVLQHRPGKPPASASRHPPPQHWVRPPQELPFGQQAGDGTPHCAEQASAQQAGARQTADAQSESAVQSAPSGKPPWSTIVAFWHAPATRLALITAHAGPIRIRISQDCTRCRRLRGFRRDYQQFFLAARRARRPSWARPRVPIVQGVVARLTPAGVTGEMGRSCRWRRLARLQAERACRPWTRGPGPKRTSAQIPREATGRGNAPMARGIHRAGCRARRGASASWSTRHASDERRAVAALSGSGRC